MIYVYLIIKCVVRRSKHSVRFVKSMGIGQILWDGPNSDFNLTLVCCKITGSWYIGHCGLYLLWVQSLHHTDSLSRRMTFFQETLLEMNQNHWAVKHGSLRRFWPLFGIHSERCLSKRLLAVPNSFISILLCLHAEFVPTSLLKYCIFMPKVQLNYVED